VQRMKRITSVLNVETDRIDNAVGTGNGGLHRTFGMCVGGDLFGAIALRPPRMPRDYAHPDAGLVQMAHDATANKASPAKYGHAAHFPIHKMILCNGQKVCRAK
jgi:hypothetical protein